jgi:hypothetical protein
MSSEMSTTNPLADYLPDAEMARLRGVTSRTQRAERQRGDGPPWVKDGRRVLYPVKSLQRISGRQCAPAGSFGQVIEKDSPRGCDARALKAVNIGSAQHSVAALESQANPAGASWPRISARAFNRLRDVEEKIALLGRAVSTGEADRGLVFGGLRASLVAAGLNEEARQ